VSVAGRAMEADQVSDFDFINGNENQTGFLAQQLNEIYPQAVSVGGIKKTPPGRVD